MRRSKTIFPSHILHLLPTWLLILVAAIPLLGFSAFAKDALDDYWMESFEMREQMVQDKFRPRYHFLPPEGRWNDINGAVFHKGRYHIGYLQKISNGYGERDFSSWQHISRSNRGDAGRLLGKGVTVLGGLRSARQWRHWVCGHSVQMPLPGA